jgi:hypothetical protein
VRPCSPALAEALAPSVHYLARQKLNLPVRSALSSPLRRSSGISRLVSSLSLPLPVELGSVVCHPSSPLSSVPRSLLCNLSARLETASLNPSPLRFVRRLSRLRKAIMASSEAPLPIHDGDFDPSHPAQKDSVHQRLRANSTIMQVKKLMGMYSRPSSLLSFGW